MHRNHETQAPPVVDRRSFLGAAGAALAGGVLLGACSGDDDDTVSEGTAGGTTAVAPLAALPRRVNRPMPSTSSWPTTCPSSSGT